MAETFKSVNADLGTSADTSIYRVLVHNTIVILCQVANVDGSNNADVCVDYDSSTTTAKALVILLQFQLTLH